MTYKIEADWNPVTKVRIAKGLSATDFAKLAGITRMRLYQIEQGDPKKLSKRVLKAVEKLGFDPEEVQADYLDWKARVAKYGKTTTPKVSVRRISPAVESNKEE